MYPRELQAGWVFWFLGLVDSLRQPTSPDGALGLPAAKLGHVLPQLEEALCAFVLSYLTSLFVCFLLFGFALHLLGQGRVFCIPDGVMCGNDLLCPRHKRSLSHLDPLSLFLLITCRPTAYLLHPRLGGIQAIRCILDLGGGSRTQLCTLALHLTWLPGD